MLNIHNHGKRVNMGKQTTQIYLLGSLFCAMVLVGCETTGSRQSAQISLDEAKAVTAEFSGAVETPPRSIEDITILLESAPETRSKSAEAALITANSEPTAAILASKINSAAFYHTRSQARRKVGMVGGEVADARRVVELSNNPDWIRDAGHSEQSAGNWKNALQLYERIAKSAGAPPHYYSSLSRAYAFTGDLVNAKKYRSRTISAYTNSRSPWKKYHLSVTALAISYTEGRWQDAEVELRTAIKAITQAGGSPADIYSWQAFLALIQLKAGKLDEAELTARKGIKASLEQFGTKTHNRVGDFVRRLAHVLLAKGRFDDAVAVIEAGKTIYIDAGMDRSASSYNVLIHMLAEIALYQGDLDVAQALFDELAENLKDNRLVFEQWFRSNPRRLLTNVLMGRSEEALPEIEVALSERTERMGSKHRETALLQATWASALSRLGRDREALSEFRTAVPLMLQRSRGGGLATESEGGQIFQRMLLEEYLALLSRLAQSEEAIEDTFDPIAEGFRIAGQARLGSVARALAASSARAAASDPELAELARAEQDTIRQIRALYEKVAELTSAPEDQVDKAVITAVRSRIDELRNARSTLIEAIERGYPDYANLINPKPATIEQAQASLNSEESLISIYVGRVKTYLWAVNAEGNIRFSATAMGRDELTESVGLLREALEPDAETLGDIPEFDLDLAHEVYQEVLEPVKAGWEDAQSLLVVANGPLGYLPLSLLPTEKTELSAGQAPLFSNYRLVPWLVRSHAVTMLPSVTSLKNLRNLPPTTSDKEFAGFGDPWFSREQAETAQNDIKADPMQVANRGLLAVRAAPVTLRTAPQTRSVSSAQLGLLPRLPETADEVESIAVALHSDLTDSLFIGMAASEDVVKTMDLSGTRVVMFATHGLVPGDLDGLSQPALALSSPAVTGGENDGLLTAGEILGLELDADWVVLSACNTAAGDGAGAEAVSGLGRAFFYAGARSLLVSNWPVETTSARALTTAVFRKQSDDPSLNRSVAIRQAMLELIDNGGYTDPNGDMVYTYAHPIFWAPFTLVGDGGS
jgi:CHAT domain-containing protein/tetratricopeptide (TPR) repeat protein